MLRSVYPSFKQIKNTLFLLFSFSQPLLLYVLNTKQLPRWSYVPHLKSINELEISISCVINRAAAGIVPSTLTHSEALHQMNRVSLFWNIHKCTMPEAASAESDDKPRREVMTCYMCPLATAAQSSAGSMLPREALIIIYERDSCVSFIRLALIVWPLVKLPDA